MTSLTRIMETGGRELRHTLRSLARAPLFTLVAVLTLAIGLGTNAAIFSVVDGLLLRALPYPEPQRLSVVSTHYRSAAGEDERWSQNGRTWELLRDHARSVDLAVFSQWPSGVNLSAGGEAAYVEQQRVGAGFFRVLGVEPARGRGFLGSEDVPGGPQVVVLSDALWRRSFAADPAILGRPILLKGEPYTVVGVMPPGFRSTAAADLWTPLRASTEGEGEGTNYGIVVRPRRGVSPAQAEAEIAALGERSLAEQGRSGDAATVTVGLRGLQDALVEGLDLPLLILWGVASLVLLVVCANLAALMLARGARRRRELAARVALGSGQGGVVRLVLTESLVLAVAGGGLGILLGRLGLDLLAALARDAVGLWQPVTLDLRVMAVSGVLALTAGVVFGLGPAIEASHTDLRRALASGGAGSLAAASGGWPRRLLVVGEVAVGVLLVVFAGILVRSFVELRSLQPGFEPDGVVAGSLSLEDARYDTRSEIGHLFGDSLARLRATPGVEAAAVGLGLPFERPLNLGVRVGGEENGASSVSTRYVTPGYTDTLRIPLLAGRRFGDADRAGAPRVAVVNRRFVERFLDGGDGGDGGDDPVGRRIFIAGEERRVVGVVGDVLVNPRGLGGTAPLGRTPMVYLPVDQLDDDLLALVHTWFQPSWIVRSALPARSSFAAIRDAVHAVDPALPFAALRTLPEVERQALGFQRFLMTLAAGLAAVALLLAALGVYGLVANSVAARTRELGIRLALGATRRQALGAVALPGIALAASGAAGGVLLAVLSARLVRSLVVGISATDPAVLLAGALLVLAVATAASVLPGLRVLRLDPARTLREE